MKRLILPYLFVFITFTSTAQISITAGDMPSANDSIRMSSALNVASFNFAQTGANYSWDFSGLIPKSQRTEKYQSIYSTPLIYQMIFMGKSNLAGRREDMSLMGINITDGYNFFDNSQSDFRQVGYGANVNGSPVPVSFKDDDIIYRFPINFGNTDSCDSEWEVNIPNLAYVNEKKHRVNYVDGWGTVITPYGSFQCLRIRSEVYQEDTIYYSSTSTGMRIPQTYTEYIWLSNTLEFPILFVTKPAIGLPTVEYADSARQFVGVNTHAQSSFEMQVYPNPAREKLSISIANPEQEEAKLEIISMSGKIVYKDRIKGDYQKSIDIKDLSAGLYYVRLTSVKTITIKKLIIEK